MNCLFCANAYKVYPYRATTTKYCSKKCFYLAKKGKPAWNKGMKYSKATIRKMNLIGLEKGRGWSKGTKGVLKGWNKGKTQIDFPSLARPERKGAGNPMWKGGITTKYMSVRKSLEYKLWRKSVYERDQYTCVNCGDDKGGNLQADHIKSFNLYPKLRFELSNGRTLCKPCHIEIGWNWWKKDQPLDYL